MIWLKRVVGSILILVFLSQYFAECAPGTRGTTQRSNIVRTTTTARPTTTARANCVENIQRDYNNEKHPVSRLYEFQAKNYESPPIFKEVGQRIQQNKKHEFNIQVTVNGRTASVWAANKKDAKRKAAIEMLTLMGIAVEAEHSNSINHC